MASIMDLKRMCEEHHYCIGCPLFYLERCMLYRLPSNIDEIVNKWVAEHPIKTYAMDFFEKFPGAPHKITGVPLPCIRVIYSDFYGKGCPKGDCISCWNREMKEGAEK